MKRKILLMGCGSMALEYAKALESLGAEVVAKGRGQASADRFHRVTGILPFLIWPSDFDLSKFDLVIVCVSELELTSAALEAIKLGAQNLLIEKPGASSPEDLKTIAEEAAKANCRVRIGFNRRFYQVVEILRRGLEKDGGAIAVHFDFSERSRVVGKLDKPKELKRKWLWHNSTHVFDTVHYLVGPIQFHSITRAGFLKWHPDGSVFAGSGITQAGALVSFNSSWEAPGGWEIVAWSRLRKFRLRPMETLSIQSHTEEDLSFREEDLDLEGLKPGIKALLEECLSKTTDGKCSRMQDAVLIGDYVSQILK